MIVISYSLEVGGIPNIVGAVDGTYVKVRSPGMAQV